MPGGDVRYVITVDEAGQTKKIETFEQAIKNLERSTGGAKTQAQSFGQELTSRLIPSFTIAQLAADGVHAGLKFIKNGFSEMIQAAIEAEEADRSLEASLAITGHAVGSAADDVKNYAEALSLKTKYDDEEIKSAEALIIQMRGTTNALEEETRGALGLASVFKMNLQGAAQAVAQGFEGNYRQLGMLIPAVRTATTEAEKHGAMVRGLADYYKRSEDEVNTFGGALSQLKKEFSETAEQAGESVTKSNLVKDAIKGITAAIRALRTETKEHPGAFLPTELNLVLNEDKNRAKNAAALKQFWQDQADQVYYEFDAAGQLIRRSAKVTEADLKSFWEIIFPPPGVIDTSGVAAYANEVEKDQKSTKEAFEKIQKAWDALLTGLDSDIAEKEVDSFFGEITATAPEVEASLQGIIDAVAPVGSAFHFSFGGAVHDVKELVDVTTKGDIRREIDQITLTLKVMGDSLPDKEVKRLTDRLKELNKELEKTSHADKAKKALEGFVTAARLVISGLDGIISQSQTNKEIAIENEYKKRLAAINANVKDETKRQQAIVALEAEYEIKRSSARAAAAKQAKAIAMMEAVVNTASAVAEALPNIPLSIVVGALGAIQIGIIAAQPIPLAQGAYFDKETVLAGRNASYRLAEAYPASKGEIVSPVPVMRGIVREEIAAADRGRPANVNLGGVTVQIYAQTLDDRTIGQAADKLIGAVKRRLRTDTSFAGAF